jgi:hypothetical protein
MLLADVRDGFAKSHLGPDDDRRLTTKQLLDWLHALEERPWSAWGKAKKPITDMQLARLLRPYGVRSTTVWLGEGVAAKGYHLRSFEDAFSRYLPSIPPEGANFIRKAVRTAGKQGESEDSAAVMDSTPNGSENAGNPSNSGGSDGLTGENEGKGRHGSIWTEIELDDASSPFVNDGGEDQ